MRTYQKQEGFTLVEIIIVISIIGIIGGLSALIIGRSLDSYAALARREKMQASLSLAIERISRELRHALPNSVCVNNGGGCISSGSGNRFYFIPVKSSGRYQDKPGAYSAPPPVQRNPLPVLPLSRDRFDVLSANQAVTADELDATAGDWISVYNINNTDIYTVINNVRHQINAVSARDIQNTPTDPSDDITQVKFTGNVSFANQSPTRRFQVIDDKQQVTLFYLFGTDLFRDTTTFTAPNTTTTNTHLLMQNVQACSFTFTPGAPQRAGLLRIDITIAQQGEQIRVIHDAHVNDTP